MQLLMDLFILNGAFVLAATLRFDDLKVENPEYYNYYVQLWVFLNLIWLLVAVVTRMYDSVPKMEIRKSIGKVINAVIIQLFVLTLMLVLLKFDLYSRLFFAYFYVIFIPLTLMGRWVFAIRLRAFYKKTENRRPVVLIGNTEESQAFYKLVTDNPEYGMRIEKWFADNSEKGVDAGLQEGLEMLSEIQASELYCGLEAHDERIKTWYTLAEKHLFRFRYLPSLGIKNLTNSSVELFGDIPVLISRKEPLEYRHNRFLKRAFDLLFATLIFVLVISWLFPILAIAIKLTSPGPVLFKQKRSGINNDVFEVFKFRSMVVNAESDTRQATDADERITVVGKFIRKHNLDEIPQFFNVFKGQMSVVGPRPHMLAHTEEYRKLIDTFMVRHLIPPGITGLAQSRGLKGETPLTENMEARVKADVYYLENWSLLLDVKIILVTVWNMIRGK